MENEQIGDVNIGQTQTTPQASEEFIAPQGKLPKKGRSGLLLSIVAILVLIIVVGGYYFARKFFRTSELRPPLNADNQNITGNEFLDWKDALFTIPLAETNDWMSYVEIPNSSIEVSMKYPPTWKISDGNAGFILMDPSVLPTKSKSAEIAPFVVQLKKGQICFDSKPQTNIGPYTFINQEIVTVGSNLSTTRRTYELGHKLKEYCVTYNDLAFQINFWDWSDDMSTDSLFNKVLSTISIKTTNASGSSTANWETYTNAEYGFSFRYPNNWSIFEFKGTEAQKYSFPGGRWEIMGIAIGKDGIPGSPDISQSSYGAGLGDQFLDNVDSSTDYIITLSSFYCGTFECSNSAHPSPFSGIDYLNKKLDEYTDNGHKIVIAQQGHYECYGCSEEVLNKDAIFALVCNEAQNTCLNISSKQVPLSQLDAEKSFIVDEFLPTLEFTQKFDLRTCTPVENACSKG